MKKTPAHRKKMSDIARMAGVSESTVSRALSDSPLVNEKTKSKIRTIAEQNNYVVNKQAQSLRTKRTNTVSVVIPFNHSPGQNVSDPFFLDLLGSIADALTEKGYDLLLSRVHKSQWRQKILQNDHVDGLIFIGQSDMHQELNEMARTTNFPIVVWGANLEDQLYMSVGCDNVEGGYSATDYLLGLGRKRIVFLGDMNIPEPVQRYEGYKKAHQQANIPVDSRLAVDTPFGMNTGAISMQSILDNNIKFDGIFAASDVIAMSAIKALYKSNLRIPEDVSIVGFDDIAMAEHLTPALTTVNQHIYRGGQLLVECLFDSMARDGMLNGQNDRKNIVMSPSLSIRQTCSRRV